MIIKNFVYSELILFQFHGQFNGSVFFSTSVSLLNLMNES